MFTRTSWLVIVAVLVLASGCALMSPTDPYAGMARGLWPYSSGGSQPATFQPVEGPLTLDEAIRVALVNNPEAAAMAHDVEALESQCQVAGSQRWPSLHMAGGYNRYLDSQRLVAATENGEAGVFSRDIFAGDLVISMPLFTGGRITSEIKAAELLQKAAEHRLARTREELVFNVSSTFYNILAQREVIESLEFSRKALQGHLKRVQDLIAVQKAANVDQLRTEVRLADLKQRLMRERNVLAVQLRVLTNLLGLDRPEKPIEPTGELAFTKAVIPEIDQALRQAFEGRSDYLAARAALEAQAKAVDAARGAQWPTISLQGTYGGRWAVNTTDQPSGMDRSDDVGRIGVVVDIPLFEGGRISARVRQEKARLLAAQERLRRLELQIQLDVETAVLNIASAAQRVEATEKAIEQAKESLRIEREKYELGKGAVVDVLDAQSALLDSQTNYYRALADYNVALAQFELATGKAGEK
jgi:outer membrane protein TolC